MNRLAFAILHGAACVLAACTITSPAPTPMPSAPAAWTEQAVGVAPASGGGRDDAWWRAFADPAIDELVQTAMQTSPTLAHAWARIDEARATVAGARAAQQPTAAGQIELARARTRDTNNRAAGVAAVSANFDWELDLFGRLRYNQSAATLRLNASEAEAQATRLALQAEVATRVLERRACVQQLAVQSADADSRALTLRLTESRRAAGLAATAEVSRAQTSLSEARVGVTATAGACAQLVHALVGLTGAPAARVVALLGPAGNGAQPGSSVDDLPVPPLTALSQPADVLAGHPSVVAALNEADAATAATAGTAAARWPRLSLTALLSQQWLRAGGNTANNDAWSLGPSLVGSIFDGGANRAAVDASRAREQQAIARLETSLRDAVRDTEAALSQLDTATQRERDAQEGVAAAERLFTANDVAWRAGRLSLFELEDARRALIAARSSLIASRRDRGQAWVALVKATGNGVRPSQ